MPTDTSILALNTGQPALGVTKPNDLNDPKKSNPVARPRDRSRRRNSGPHRQPRNAADGDGDGDGDSVPGIPRFHHLDKRATDLAERGAVAGDPDDLLTTKQMADWFGVSTQWFEIGRHLGYGPKFIRLSPRRVRYRRGDGLAYLANRTHASTAEYACRPSEGADDAAA